MFLLKKYKHPKFLEFYGRLFFAALIIVGIFVIIIFPYIDANFLYYTRIEKRIDNLARLAELTNVPLEENEILYEEYLSIFLTQPDKNRGCLARSKC